MGTLDNVKIRTMGKAFVAVLVAVGAILISASLVINGAVGDISTAWDDFQGDRSNKARLVNTLRAEIGYGGMIHQFKNYVLRHDDKRIAKVETRIAGAVSTIEQYEGLGTSEAEQAALDAVRGVLAAYGQALEKARSLTAQGESARDIDRLIKIDDRPALDGLARLDEFVAAEVGRDGGRRTKTQLIAAVSAAVGYGGMIHQFKNYVLRHDAQRIDKIRARLDGTDAILDEYAALGVNDAEGTALADIRGVMDAYGEAVATVKRLAAQGKTPEQVDSVIKIDDGPALAALVTLRREIASENEARAAEIDSELSLFATLGVASMAVTVLAVAVLVALSVWLIQRRILRPITAITGTMGRLAEGDTSIEVEGAGRKDEIGAMAGAVQVFKDNKIAADRLAEEQRREQEAKERRQRAIEALMAEFESGVGTVLGQVAKASDALKFTAESMASTADQTSHQATVVAAASEQASTNVQAVASAADELSSSIGEISRQVAQSSGIAAGAVEDSEGANHKIQGLAQAAQKIGEVLALITDIADQTNLLALNATIEAARAGDAGRGFAVVASEVKNLANQTAKATEQIGTHVVAIQAATEEAVGAIGAIGATIAEINEIAAAVAAAVEEQGAATQEIARNVEQAAAGTREVTENITGVNRAAGDSGEAANQVLEAAGSLTEQSDTLRRQVENFLTGIKAA